MPNAHACGLRLNDLSLPKTFATPFDDPAKETVCEEVGDDVVVMKDRRGRVIGFERLNYLTKLKQAEGLNIPVEVQMV